jgi:hypothetical protein
MELIIDPLLILERLAFYPKLYMSFHGVENHLL